GASAWIAHSKLSNVWCFPPTTTANALSYSFSQTSHIAIHKPFARRKLRGGVQFYCSELNCAFFNRAHIAAPRRSKAVQQRRTPKCGYCCTCLPRACVLECAALRRLQ